MSQKDILDFLENHKGKWFTKKEIAKELGIMTGSVTANINRIFRANHMWHLEVKRIKNKKFPTKSIRVYSIGGTEHDL